MNPQAATATRSPEGIDGGQARLAVSRLFHLGDLSATAQALAGTRAAGIQVVEAVLRHLGGDWGEVDDITRAANDHAVVADGTLRSVYPLGTGDAVVVTTDAERRHTVAALGSEIEPGR